MRFLKWFGAAASAIFLAAALAACGASGGGSRAIEESPAAVGPPTALEVVGGKFVPGETMRFELSLKGIIGGEASIAVGDPGLVDGKRVIIVKSRVESAGVVAMFKEVRDDVTTWIDLESGLPLNYLAHVKFGKRESIIETKFAEGDGGVAGLDVEVRRLDTGSRRVVHLRLPPEQSALDAHAVIGALRAWQGETGQYTFFYVLVGRFLWQNTIRMVAKERLRTPLGRFDALRIDGVARRLTRTLKEDPKKPPRYYTLWLSDDEARLPLKVTGKTEYGDVEAVLVEYQAPSQLRAAR